MAYTYKHGDRPLEGITIQRAVGRGGFGEVYYAVSDSGKQLALKYLRENPEVELRGISHVMNLKSPHLVTIYDVKKDAHDGPWVVMEYVSGPSLRDIMNNEPAGLGPAKAAFFLEGIAKGLAYLHERGIVHRDLKPGNIFYDDGYVKIGDYGLSKHMSVSQHSGNTISVGTVHYMAPEIGSGNYTKAIDIYALGVMLFEMLTGKLPFAGSSMGEILMRHLSERPDVSSVPEPFRSVIAKALAKDPAQRYQDVNEMVDIVKAATDMAGGMSTFDPKTLTHVPRNANVVSAERTMTSTPVPPPPPMDVRGAGWSQALPAKVQKRVDRIRKRLDQKVAKLERKLGVSAPIRPKEPREAAAGHRNGARGRWGRYSRMFLLMAIAFGAAMGLSLTVRIPDQPRPELIFTTLFLLAGGVFGSLITYFKLLNRDDFEGVLFDRLAYMCVAALCMAPALAPASALDGPPFMKILFVPLILLGIFDWTRRIDDGRAGIVSGGAAFLPGLAGLIIANVLDLDAFQWLAAGFAAVFSLLTQATASLFPLPRYADNSPTAGEAGYGSPLRTEALERPVGPAAGAGPAAHAAQPLPPLPPLPPAPASQDRALREDSPRLVLDRPSFVVRTANAGLSFVGKIAILIGLSLAAFYHAPGFEMRDGENVVHIGGSEILVHDGDEHLQFHVPQALVIAPVVLGGFLLALARRQDGGLHFFRGFVGALLGIVACIFMLGPTGVTIASVLTGQDWHDLPRSELKNLLVPSTLLVLSACTLLWPKARHYARMPAH